MTMNKKRGKINHGDLYKINKDIDLSKEDIRWKKNIINLSILTEKGYS